MRFVYFDEVKYHPPKQPYHWNGALSVDAERLPQIEGQINDLAREYFHTARLTRETEFHAVDIFHRKHQFREWTDVAMRVECLERLASIADNPDAIRKIYVRIDPSRMIRDGWEEDAFMFFVERCQRDAARCNDKCILIGDLDGEYADGSVSNLSRFRADGTDFQYGQVIDRLLDSVYFIPSHHSRLLQLADVYTYIMQLAATPNEADDYPRRRLKAFVREKTSLLAPNAYKEWPTQFSRFQSS